MHTENTKQLKTANWWKIFGIETMYLFNEWSLSKRNGQNVHFFLSVPWLRKTESTKSWVKPDELWAAFNVLLSVFFVASKIPLLNALNRVPALTRAPGSINWILNQFWQERKKLPSSAPLNNVMIELPISICVTIEIVVSEMWIGLRWLIADFLFWASAAWEIVVNERKWFA